LWKYRRRLATDSVGYGDVAVVESGQASEHGGQDGRVESRVDLGCAFEQEPDVVALCDVVDIGEIAGFGAVEEGEQLPAGEFFECERGAGDAFFRWQLRWGVEGEVDEEVVVACDDESAEGVAVADAPDRPAATGGGVLEGVAGRRDGPAAGAGEQVEVLGGAGGEVLAATATWNGVRPAGGGPLCGNGGGLFDQGGPRGPDVTR
jgi:hypothetical protein